MSSTWVWDPNRRDHVYKDANGVWRDRHHQPLESAQAVAQDEEEDGDEEQGADGAEQEQETPRSFESPYADFHRSQTHEYPVAHSPPAHARYSIGPNLSDITEGVAAMSTAGPSEVPDDTGKSVILGMLDREPKYAVTDPDLFKKGVVSRGKIKPTPGDSERLDSGFRVQRKPKEFFVPGKVFRILWPEHPGPRPADNITVITDAGGMRGANFIMKFRWFVVVKAGNNFCSCLPIATYQGRAATKTGLVKSQHSIIYSGKQEPSPLTHEAPKEGEKGMMPAIRVNPTRKIDKMDPKSRLDYSRVYTVDHCVKVKDFGTVHEKYVKQLIKQWWLVFKDSLELDSDLDSDKAERGEPSGDGAGANLDGGENNSNTFKRWAIATQDFNGRPDLMELEEGDRIAVYDYTTDDWWKGFNTRTRVTNMFPSSYVELYQDD